MVNLRSALMPSKTMTRHTELSDLSLSEDSGHLHRGQVTLGSGRNGRPMAAADGWGSSPAADEATARESCPLLQAPCGRSRAFECMVCHCQVRSSVSYREIIWRGTLRGRTAPASACLS
jgi:hypothetical protein